MEIATPLGKGEVDSSILSSSTSQSLMNIKENSAARDMWLECSVAERGKNTHSSVAQNWHRNSRPVLARISPALFGEVS